MILFPLPNPASRPLRPARSAVIRGARRNANAPLDPALRDEIRRRIRSGFYMSDRMAAELARLLLERRAV